MIQKIVINTCFGSFSLSTQAILRYGELANIKFVTEVSHGLSHYYKNSIANENYWSDRDIDRDDPLLIQIIEELGEAANGFFAELKIVEIPAGVLWDIEEYDGVEHIAEQHRTWS